MRYINLLTDLHVTTVAFLLRTVFIFRSSFFRYRFVFVIYFFVVTDTDTNGYPYC